MTVDAERLLRQHERLAKLGTLAAGIAHELNNPAAAVSRAAELLQHQVALLEPVAERLAGRTWSKSELELLHRLARATASVDQATRELDALARTDREDAVSDWLSSRGIGRGWELAPMLVDRGVTAAQLDELARGCNPGTLADALAWTEHSVTIHQLLEELGQGTARISELVRAVKMHAKSDTGTLRTADIHEGLESSLTILGYKLKQAKATVSRDYDRTLPPVQSYGAELSQVWTNLVDNAADAVAPNGGTVRVRTYRAGAGVGVEIADNGRGIAADALDRVFEPFFTTKEATGGTGLGLEIAKRIVRRHGGTIAATSKAADTRFTVWLPLTQDERSR